MNPSISRSFLQDFLQKHAKGLVSSQRGTLSHPPHGHLVTKCRTYHISSSPSNLHLRHQNMLVPAVASSFYPTSSWSNATTSNSTHAFTIRSFSDDKSSSPNNSQGTTPNSETSSNDGKNTTDSQEQTTENDTQQEQPSSSSSSDNEVTKLQAELKEMKDQLLRSLAEQENIRRIAQRDVENARNFAVSSFAKSLLDTSDNLTRAMEAVPEEYRQDNEEHPVLATLYEGIRMTEEGLIKAFAKNGLKRFGERGDKFDPNMHDALFEYKDDALEAGSVGQVMKVGYTLNNRVIRPAEVGVVKKA
jgi:Molecular chaperone GrpE (heat shock protein)